MPSCAQPLRFLSPDYSQATFEQYRALLEAAVGFSLEVTYPAMQDLGAIVENSASTVGKSYYDGWGASEHCRGGWSGHVSAVVMRRARAPRGSPCTSAASGAAISVTYLRGGPRRGTCEAGGACEVGAPAVIETSWMLPLVAAGMPEPMDPFINNDAGIAWLDVHP